MLKTLSEKSAGRPRPPQLGYARRGIFMVLAAFCLVAVMAFIALSVDLGVISLTKTRMQNAVDAAALAAATEISNAVQDAGQQGGDVGDANSIAVGAAKAMAAQVAELNGIYVDPEEDVRFGKRIYNGTNFEILWGVSPYNVVQVFARRDNEDAGAPDSKLQLFFAPVLGNDSVALAANAIAFVEARDIAVVLDYSGSMGYDSHFRGLGDNSLADIESRLDDCWDAMVDSGVTFTNTSKVKFPSTGFGGINSAAGVYNSSDNSETVFNALQLGATNADGSLKFPFPQEGKNSNGTMKGLPSASSSKTMWKAYIDYVRTDSYVNNAGYRKEYGYRTLMNYLLSSRRNWTQSEDLWRTPHQPFDSMKKGMTLFCEFLDGLEFGDHLGLVVYGTTSKIMTGLDEADLEESVNLGDELITGNHMDIDTIQKHKQAAHYDGETNIGDGLKDAITLLENHGRYGARPTILLMTDGIANQKPAGWSLPAGWNWADLTDSNGDGTADYTSSNANIQYTFYQAKRAIDKGFTIHTLAVGAGADVAMMQAIANAGGGICIVVPGNSNIEELQDELLAAFSQIAANVPPPKLLMEETEE